MKNQIKISIGIILCFLLILLPGCTKEKAEAIKVAAQNFRAQAATALDQIRVILKQNVESPPIDNDQLVNALSQTNFTYDSLQFLLNQNQTVASASTPADKQIEGVEKNYVAFAEMFESLPEGHFFAANSVEQSEKFAVNLTVQMINFADLIQKGEIPVHLHAKRVLLLEQIQKDNAIADDKIKQDLLKKDGQQLIALAAEEAQLRDEAVAQCLKAAETGRALTDLIRNYKTLSIGEMLTLTQQSMNSVAELSGQNKDVVSVLNRYKNFEAAIQADPYWSKLLDEKINLKTTN